MIKKVIVIVGCALLVVGLAYFNSDMYYEYRNEKILNTLFPLDEDILTDRESIDENTYDQLYISICEKCDYGYDLTQCSDVEKNYFLLYNFSGEVGNGGIEQFFYNCFEYVDETLEVLKEENWECSYEYLKQAKDIYPEDIIEMYSDDDLSHQLDQLDNDYYDKHEEEFYENIEKYIKTNWEALSQY